MKAFATTTRRIGTHKSTIRSAIRRIFSGRTDPNFIGAPAASHVAIEEYLTLVYRSRIDVRTVAYGLGVLAPTCYKTEMPKIIERWLLFTYIHGEFTPLSKPFKTKEQAEWARLKYPERERGAIGVGMIRIKR